MLHVQIGLTSLYALEHAAAFFWKRMHKKKETRLKQGPLGRDDMHCLFNHVL